MKTQSPPKVLVVDDEADVTALVSYHLGNKGYDVESLNDPHRVLNLARKFLPNVFILDVMMPDLSGIQLCRLLRNDSQFKKCPIIFLTAKTEEGDRIKGLEVGADDYICKPFSPRELVLRVEGILRRLEGSGEDLLPPLEAGPIKIDQERHIATLSKKKMDLTATEFRLLSLLIERRGRVQSREQLLANVWNYDSEMETRTVDTHVRRIREKLGKHADLIETIRGVGYRVREDP